jgi:hypothetical protein
MFNASEVADLSVAPSFFAARTEERAVVLSRFLSSALALELRNGGAVSSAEAGREIQGRTQDAE